MPAFAGMTVGMKKEMVGFDRLSPNGVGRMKGLSVQLLSLFPFGLSSSKPSPFFLRAFLLLRAFA